MQRYELIKTIEAHKLNPRSGLPLTEPPVSIPYSAIIEKVKEDWDVVKFSYLGLRYQCPTPTFKEAAKPYGSVADETGPSAAAVSESRKAPSGAPDGKDVKMRWEELTSSHHVVLRAKVRGGWLVCVRRAGLTFYPDAKHAWDGRSLD